MPEDPGSTAERLKRVRRREGWSQRELAKRLEVDPTAVRDWENGAEPKLRRCQESLRSLLADFDGACCRLQVDSGWTP